MEGKDCLKRIDLFDSLLQKTSRVHRRADVESCRAMYGQNFGLLGHHDLFCLYKSYGLVNKKCKSKVKFNPKKTTSPFNGEIGID